MDDLAGSATMCWEWEVTALLPYMTHIFGLAKMLLNVSHAAEQEIINAIKDSDAYQLLIDVINSPGRKQQ